MKRLYTIVFTFISFFGNAQDPEFSQYYAAPLYLNPAFTGTTMDHRFMANYRNQWPNVARGYQSYVFSYDYNMEYYNSGVGFLATVDKAGTAGMKSSQFNFLYSYKWSLNSKWVISSGLNFGYAFRSIDFNKLLFGDQLQFDTNGNIPSDDPAIFRLGSVNYFDFNAGILVYNQTFWLGAASSHINQPNRSLVNEDASVPIKTTVHGGVRIPLYWGPFKMDRVSVLSPSFVYKKQGNFSQLDVGAYFLYDPIALGLWYRGIPIKQNALEHASQDAVVVILGFQFDKVEIGYSYDFTVSELGPISGGTHEVSLQYKLAIHSSSRPKKKQKYIPCPTFNKK